MIWVNPESHGKCPYKSDAEGDLKQRHTGGSVTTEAENGVMQSQAKDAWNLEGSSLRGSGGSLVLPTP